jgi:hypothetical protein
MKTFLLAVLITCSISAFSQDTLRAEQEEPEKTRGFQKDHLFTGGSITLSFSSDGTVLGASPVFGYSITKWLDAGIVFNYISATQRHFEIYSPDDKLRQTTIGPGAFVRIFPVKFLFVHVQGEQNYIKQTLIPDDNTIPRQNFKVDATSLLLGAGYCNGREGIGDTFYYLSLLFDVAKNKNSPYVEQTQSGKINVLPIIRAGLQIPLFQEKRGL